MMEHPDGALGGTWNIKNPNETLRGAWSIRNPNGALGGTWNIRNPNETLRGTWSIMIPNGALGGNENPNGTLGVKMKRLTTEWSIRRCATKDQDVPLVAQGVPLLDKMLHLVVMMCHLGGPNELHSSDVMLM
ncbi:unnamed protein product [Lactuca virosa]|uniref:P/Homo B domain-containing protein n=1 Tax=Lactuca virosa TaxID=75947 RepID=A0AAU9P6U2_9ASTR|nr:unnamed protein product [Lactuca virosa]